MSTALRRPVPLVLLAVLCATASSLNAQPQAREGDRVRLTADGSPTRLVGTLLQVRSDSLVLQARQQRLTIARSALTRLEVSRGQRSALGRGALVGALSGLLGGIVVGSVACLSYNIEVGTCLNSHDGGQLALLTPVALGLLGGLGIGSLIGLASHTERWEVRPLAEPRVGLTIRVLPGLRLGLGVRLFP